VWIVKVVKRKSHLEVRRVFPAVLVNTGIIALNVKLVNTVKVKAMRWKMPRNALNARLVSIKTFRECVAVAVFVFVVVVVVLVVVMQSTHFFCFFLPPHIDHLIQWKIFKCQRPGHL
jgi:hypothetical protein